MTWAEFKRGAEAAGVVETDVIAYIDWSGYFGEQVGAFQFGQNDGQAGHVAIDDSELTIAREAVHE